MLIPNSVLNWIATTHVPVQSDNLTSTSESNRIVDGTTDFIAPNVVTNQTLPLSIPGSIARSYFPNDVTSIIQYLNKPIPVTSGSWNTGHTAGTLLYNQDTWTGVFANTMWKNKLFGIFGLRATLRVDLVLNATPFHQGRLRLCYYPAASTNRSKALMHISNRIPLSQLPGIDMGTADSTVSLMIPYVNVGRFIELPATGFVWSWGDLYLTVMSPLQIGASGDSDVDYTIWYSMHDVELIGQTNKAVSQSGSGKIKAKRVAPSDSEMRPLSHLLGAAADFSSAVGKIPLLTPWAGPVSWFLNAAKGAAVSFGFSKPLITEVPCAMSSNYNWYTTTSDGFDNSMQLSVLGDAKLRLLDDVNESHEDQMSLSFIKTRWSFYQQFTLAESNTLGQQVYSLSLIPNNFFEFPAADEGYYTPISYLCSLYSMYRGGIEVMFKFVKTGFHAGSIAITFVPGPTDTTISLTDSSYAYRTVIDLQEGDEACFTCPYLLPLDYIDVTIGLGKIYVHVVNPLRSPETCSNDFDVLVYVRGASSFDVQKPQAWHALPVTLQGGEVENNSKDITCEAPGDGPTGSYNEEFCQEAMSECSTSTLQLIKMFHPISFEFADAVNDDVVIASPWALSSTRLNVAKIVFRGIFDPIMSQVLAPFAFYRGGMRWRTYASTSGSDLTTTYFYRADNTSNVTSPWIDTDTATLPIATNSSIPGGITFTQRQPFAANNYSHGGLSVNVPYQCPYRMAPVQFCNVNTPNTNFFTPRPSIVFYPGANKNRLVSRAVSDDFQALFWVGIPRMSG